MNDKPIACVTWGGKKLHIANNNGYTLCNRSIKWTTCKELTKENTCKICDKLKQPTPAVPASWGG